MPSKKKLKKKINQLASDLAFVSSDRDAWLHAANAAKINMNEWRKKYELSQLTPEVKADTEAAFKRGAAHAKTSMLNGIRDMIINLPEVPNA